MNDEATPTEPLPTPDHSEQRPRRLLRSRRERMIWGVAGGLGRYFNVDPVIFRIAFGVSLFFGGLGLIAYAALAIFVPSGDDGQVAEAAPYERKRWLGVAAGIALALAVIPAGAGLFWGGHWGWGVLGVVTAALAVAFAVGLYILHRGSEDPGETRGGGSRLAV